MEPSTGAGGARPMRIAMLIWSYWPGHEGGAERQCRKLVPHLAAQGVEVAVWTARTRLGHPRRETAGGATIVRFGRLLPLLLAPRRGLEALLSRLPAGGTRAGARFREALLFWLGLAPTLAARLCFLGGLRLWLRRERNRPDVIHVHESSWLAGAAALLARRHRIPVLAKTASFPAWDTLGYDVPLRGALSRARRECRFVALSRFLADDLTANGVPAERIFLVNNGVEFPERAAEPAGAEEVLFVANFSQSVEHKAFDVLLEAWRLVVAQRPAARLHLLGDGDRAPWERLVRAMGLEGSALFAGWTPDPSAFYRRGPVFALPSRWEGMSNALLEAQSWGLACVVSDVPGNAAVVEHGRNGLLVPPGDAPALADAILRLFSDRQLRAELGCAARARMNAEYSLDGVARRLRGIYGQLARAAASTGSAA